MQGCASENDKQIVGGRRELKVVILTKCPQETVLKLLESYLLVIASLPHSTANAHVIVPTRQRSINNAVHFNKHKWTCSMQTHKSYVVSFAN